MATQIIQFPTQSRQSNGTSNPSASRFNRLMAWTLAILVPAEIILVQTVHLSGLISLLNIWPVLLALIAVLFYCRWSRRKKLIDLAEMAIWSVLLTNILSLLILIAGRSSRPLQDHSLAAADSWMHFNTASLVHWIATYPALRIAALVAYDSLPWLILTAVLVPPLCGHTNASRRFILGIILSAIITAALFALWPAAGPWTTQNFPPARDQGAVTAYLALLNSHAPAVIDMQNAGIVSFPSYHVVLAILSALTLNSVRPLRVPVWILTALICVSTVLTGWHYGIDVIGGLIVTIVSAWTVRRIAV